MSSILKVDTLQDVNGNAIISSDGSGNLTPNTFTGLTISGNLSVDGGTIKLDGNHPDGTDNVALGNTALDSLTSGTNNTAIGSSALTANTTASNNTAVGYQALYANNAVRNTAIGYNSLRLTVNDDNTAVGANSLESNTSGYYNVGMGYLAGNSNTTGISNVAIGTLALRYNTTASNNTAVGHQSLQNNTDSGNTAVGYQSLYANTSGSFNSSLGRDSLKANTTGITNTGIGHSALSANTTASKNTGLGYGGLFVNTTGANNTSVGAYSMYSNLTGSNNVAVGTDALYNNTASDNTAVIRYYHTGVNTLIGTFNNSPAESATEDGIRLGDNGGCQFSANGLEVMRINRNTNDGRIIGLCGQTTVRGEIAVSGTIIQYTSFSDHRLKEDVQQISNATESLKQLNPVNFAWIDGGVRMNGFLAHEVQSVVPEAVTGTHNEIDADGNPVYQGIDQSKLVPLLVATIKELEARITALEGA
jgi:hypothetical protein